MFAYGGGKDGPDHQNGLFLVIRWAPAKVMGVGVLWSECAADALTKALGRRLFEKFRPFLLGVAPHGEAAALVAQAYARATAAVAHCALSNDDAIIAMVASIVSRCA